MKTKFDSFNIGGLPDGCQQCVRGEKLVLFMGGRCSRSCWYCSLSDSRKKCRQIFANERVIKNAHELIEEAELSNAKGAGITGGDPLVEYEKTLLYAKTLKERFGSDFHIHIYLPLKLVSKDKIERLRKYVDEFRFHPSFLINDDLDLTNEEIKKLEMVNSIVGKDRMGLELPMMPNKQKEIYNYIKNIKDSISFVNLNEFELSETNFKIITKDYSLNEDTYTVRNSITEGKKLMKELKKNKINIKIHLCSARTKDCHQYVNRMKLREILPYGKKTKNGTVIYYIILTKNLKEDEKTISKITSEYYIDKEKKRIIIKKRKLRKLYRETNLKFARIEEHPSYMSDYLEIDYL